MHLKKRVRLLQKRKEKKDRCTKETVRSDLKKSVRLLQKRQIAAQKEGVLRHLQEGVRLRLPP